MWKFFDHEGSKEWIYVLEDLVEGINASVNRSIGMAPNQVNENTSALVFVKLYGHPVTLTKPNLLWEIKCMWPSTQALWQIPVKRHLRKVTRQVSPGKLTG